MLVQKKASLGIAVFWWHGGIGTAFFVSTPERTENIKNYMYLKHCSLLIEWKEPIRQ